MKYQRSVLPILSLPTVVALLHTTMSIEIVLCDTAFTCFFFTRMFLMCYAEVVQFTCVFYIKIILPGTPVYLAI